MMRTPEQAVRDYVRARESTDLDLLNEVVAPGFSHMMLGREQDREGLFAEVRSLPSVFAEMRHDIGVLVSSGGDVSCQYTFHARHVGSMPITDDRIATTLGLRSVPPTNRMLALTGLFIARVRNGQLQSGWGEYARLTMMTQLGILD
jgi:predicted ester cyclase